MTLLFASAITAALDFGSATVTSFSALARASDPASASYEAISISPALSRNKKKALAAAPSKPYTMPSGPPKAINAIRAAVTMDVNIVVAMPVAVTPAVNATKPATSAGICVAARVKITTPRIFAFSATAVRPRTSPVMDWTTARITAVKPASPNAIARPSAAEITPFKSPPKLSRMVAAIVFAAPSTRSSSSPNSPTRLAPSIRTKAPEAASRPNNVIASAVESPAAPSRAITTLRSFAAGSTSARVKTRPLSTFLASEPGPAKDAKTPRKAVPARSP